MVGPDVIRMRIGVLMDALGDLRRYRSRFDAKSLAADRDAQHMVLHALYVAAQAAIDIALHAVAASEQPESKTYQQAFQQLEGAGMLSKDLADRMRGWAGLRNVLAHQYATIDMSRIATTLVGELPDLEEFAGIASTWIRPASD